MIDDVLPGGGFLVANVPIGKIFSREHFSDTQKEFADVTTKFMQNEVIPKAEALEDKPLEGDLPVMVSLLREVGELGLLSVDLPEEHDGLGQDKSTASIIAEHLFGCPSFATTVGAHAGIGTLPISFFGTEEQKARWLPKLGTAELVSCYALTEPGAGSDALSGRTTAIAKEDGKHFLISGEKQFITNGAWADIAIVFAQVEGKYTAFIVELDSKGVSRGLEEKKMGIKGSSTTSLVFDEVEVPVENMLGKPGMAPQIALNILNLGRLKLGFGALGNCKYAIDLSLEYASTRKQFGQPIAYFDLQKGRLADMIANTFALDALAYRLSGDIDAALANLEKDDSYAKRTIDTFRAYALECAIVKVVGAETLQKLLNDGIRLHGGYGFLNEYKLEMLARDNVIDSIYEGTNDINRLTIFDGLARNILGGGFPFRQFMETIDADLRNGRICRLSAEGPLAAPIADCMAAKRVVAYTVNQALIQCGKGIKTEQQVMELVADMLIAVSKMDSTVARAQEIIGGKDAQRNSAAMAIADYVCRRGAQTITTNALDVLDSVVPQGQRKINQANLATLIGCLDRTVDIVRVRRIIADAAIEAGAYQF